MMNIWHVFLNFVLLLKATLLLDTYRQEKKRKGRKKKKSLDISLPLYTTITQNGPLSLWYFCYSSPKGPRQQCKQELKIASREIRHFNDLIPSWSQNNITKYDKGSHHIGPCLGQMISEQTLLIPQASLVVLAGSVPALLSTASLPVVHLLSSFFCFVLSILPSWAGTPRNEHQHLTSPAYPQDSSSREMVGNKASWLSVTRIRNWTSF